MRSVSTSLTAQDLADTMFGGLVDVSKMGPDPSSVHVPGFGGKPRAKRLPNGQVVKFHVPMGALRAGRFASMGQTLGLGGAHAGGQGLSRGAAAGAHGQDVNGLRRATNKLVKQGEKVPKIKMGAPKTDAASEAMTARPMFTQPDKLMGDPLTRKVATGPGAVQRGINARSSTATKVGAGAVGATLLARRGQGDVYKLDDRTKRQVTAGLSATGAVAGAGGLAYAGHDILIGRRKAVRAGTKYKIPMKTKALIPLEIAGLGGEVAATAILHGDTKKPVSKRVDVEIAGTFSKFDDEKKRAYGWASVVTMDGEPVVDRQGDYIGLDDIEEAAYTYVRKSRVTGDMHRRTTGEDGSDSPHKAGELIESVVFTVDKCHAMGLPANFAGKWWMGVQVEDDEVWAEVKKGNRTGFSIHGKGLRKDTTLEDIRAGR